MIPEQTSEVLLKRNKGFKYLLTEMQQVEAEMVTLREDTASVEKRLFLMNEIKVITTTTSMK